MNRDTLVLPRWAVERCKGAADRLGYKLLAETVPVEEENLGLLHGLKVTERTSWGLSDTVVLRGPASVDEDGRPIGPDELEIKISSPTRMGLGGWFKDEELYTLEFGPQSEEPVVVSGRVGGPIVIPAMTVVERTLWGLSMTCRLQVEAGTRGKVEVKLSLPWPEDRFLKEGQLYSVIFEPVKGEEEEVEPPEEDEQPYREQHYPCKDCSSDKDCFECGAYKKAFAGHIAKDEQERLTSQHLDEALRAIYDEVQVPDFDGLKTALMRQCRQWAYIGGQTWEVHLDEVPKMDPDRLVEALDFAHPMFTTGWFDGQPWEDDDADDE